MACAPKHLCRSFLKSSTSHWSLLSRALLLNHLLTMSAPANVSGVYREYKIATNVFVGWVLATNDKLINPNSKNRQIQSHASNSQIDEAIANIIISDATNKHVIFAANFLFAFKSCIRAIFLREKVAKLFPNAEDDAHLVFIANLKRWKVILEPLRQEYVATLRTEKVEIEQSTTHLENMFENLELSEGTEWDGDDELIYSPEQLASIISLEDEKGYAVGKRKLSLTLSCLFSDLESILGRVSSAWHQLKQEKVTVVAATSATLIGLRLAKSVHDTFLLTYPSFKTATDIYLAGVDDFLPPNAMQASQVLFTDNLRETCPKVHNSGTILFELKMITDILIEYSQICPFPVDNRPFPNGFIQRGSIQ